MDQAKQDLMLGGRVQPDEFATLIKAFKTPYKMENLMLLEMQPRFVIKPEQRQDLLLFSTFKPEVVAAYTSGRIFHIHGELRWEKQQAHIQVVYTGESTYAPILNDGEHEYLDAPTIRNYFLFGTRLDEGQRERIGPATQPGDFAEARIPRLLRYPDLPALRSAQRIQLAVCEYIDATTGVNIAYRFKELVPFKKS